MPTRIYSRRRITVTPDLELAEIRKAMASDAAKEWSEGEKLGATLCELDLLAEEFWVDQEVRASVAAIRANKEAREKAK